MGFIEIAVWFMIFVVLSVAETAIAIFLNALYDDENGFGFFLMMILSCVALAIMIAYLLSTNGLI